VRLYKVELHEVADETGLVLHVHHFPPGTAKWNKDRAPPVLSHHPELRWVRRGLTPYGFAIGELPVRQQPEADAFYQTRPLRRTESSCIQQLLTCCWTSASKAAAVTTERSRSFSYLANGTQRLAVGPAACSFSLPLQSSSVAEPYFERLSLELRRP
jgi:Rhodopirellula transposase DDE domain